MNKILKLIDFANDKMTGVGRLTELDKFLIETRPELEEVLLSIPLVSHTEMLLRFKVAYDKMKESRDSLLQVCRRLKINLVKIEDFCEEGIDKNDPEFIDNFLKKVIQWKVGYDLYQSMQRGEVEMVTKTFPTEIKTNIVNISNLVPSKDEGLEVKKEETKE